MSGERPLSGVKVLELGQIYNGPYCGMLFAYLGADVIKIEPPGGELLRQRSGRGGVKLPSFMLNSNKRCVVLNLKLPEGKEVLKRMVAQSDVLIENFSAGTMERLGLGYDVLSAINPRLVYAAGSGYGSYGPYTSYPAMDVTIQAISGVMSITGFPDRPPVKAGPAIADFNGGVHLFAGALAALYRRERTGRGDYVEVAMFDAMFPTLMSNLGLYLAERKVVPRTANRHGGLATAPYNVYAAADGWVAIFCVTDAQWQRLCAIMERPELASPEHPFGDIAGRVRHIDEVDATVEAWTKPRRRDEIVALLLEHDVPCAPVRDIEEVVHDPHYRARNMVIPIDHPRAGPLVVPGSPIKFRSAPEVEIEPAHDVGADTVPVLREFGYSDDEIEALRARGVLG